MADGVVGNVEVLRGFGGATVTCSLLKQYLLVLADPSGSVSSGKTKENNYSTEPRSCFLLKLIMPMKKVQPAQEA